MRTRWEETESRFVEGIESLLAALLGSELDTRGLREHDYPNANHSGEEGEEHDGGRMVCALSGGLAAAISSDGQNGGGGIGSGGDGVVIHARVMLTDVLRQAADRHAVCVRSI